MSDQDRKCDCMDCWEDGYKEGEKLISKKYIIANWSAALIIGFLIGSIF